jgi:hypothetical protein
MQNSFCSSFSAKINEETGEDQDDNITFDDCDVDDSDIDEVRDFSLLSLQFWSFVIDFSGYRNS